VDALVELPADRDVVDLRGGGSDGLVNANDEPKRGVLVEERLLRLVVRGFAPLANANGGTEPKDLVRIVRVIRKPAVACALLLDGTISEGVWRAPPRAPACPSATSRASSDRRRPAEPSQPTRAPGAQRAPRAPEDSTRWALPGWARVSRTAAARQTEPVNVGASEGCYTKCTPAAPKNGPRCDS